MKDAEVDVGQVLDFGAPRRTGFYASAFEAAQKSGAPLIGVAFRRSENSTVEIFKVDNQEQIPSVMAALIADNVRYEDMWPIVILVGLIEEVVVRVKMPDAPAPGCPGPGCLGCARCAYQNEAP